MTDELLIVRFDQPSAEKLLRFRSTRKDASPKRRLERACGANLALVPAHQLRTVSATIVVRGEVSLDVHTDRT